MAVTGEYGTGMIRTSLTAQPRRLVTLLAKLIVFTGVALVTGLICSFASFFIGQSIFKPLNISVGLGDPNAVSWGTTLYWAQNNAALQTGEALWAIAPGALIAILGAAFALLNYAFDEIGNPALRPVRKTRKKGAQPVGRGQRG